MSIEGTLAYNKFCTLCTCTSYFVSLKVLSHLFTEHFTYPGYSRSLWRPLALPSPCPRDTSRTGHVTRGSCSSLVGTAHSSLWPRHNLLHPHSLLASRNTYIWYIYFIYYSDMYYANTKAINKTNTQIPIPLVGLYVTFNYRYMRCCCTIKQNLILNSIFKFQQNISC